MTWIHGAWAVFEKDLRLEMRSRYAVNLLLMFVLSSLVVVVIAAGNEAVAPRLRSALLWIVILFSASIGLGRSFVSEEESGTMLLLRLNASGSMVYAGKLAFNYVLLLGVDIVATFVFAVLMKLSVTEPLLLAFVLLLGSLGLAGATTLLAAIIARASNRGPLLPVLSFPIIMPLLLLVVSATRAALTGGDGWDGAATDLASIVGFAGSVITLAVLLFDYVWED